MGIENLSKKLTDKQWEKEGKRQSPEIQEKEKQNKDYMGKGPNSSTSYTQKMK